MNRGAALIEALRDPSVFGHGVENLRVLETHISWVILTGTYAYKIKKPIRLEFLDFSTLELRRHWCEEELRLNSRWAPSVYLDVVAITGSIDQPRVGGDGAAIEYAVRMAQFPQDALLSAELEKGNLDAGDMRELAEMIADRHLDAPANRERRFGGPDAVMKPMLENFSYLEHELEPALLDSFERWTDRQLDENRQVIIERCEDGFVRECHGDLHLRNLVRLASGIVAFDCIEFSDELRMLDVISDLSFLTMDLVAASRADLAGILLNRYLECTGDYPGLVLYRLYFVYHCLIRAKVHAIQAGERDDSADEASDLDLMRHYAGVAADWLESAGAGLVLMHGLSGSGKTRVSEAFVERLGAVRIRSDMERKRMHGLKELDSSTSAPGAGLYDEAASTAVYERLNSLAGPLLRAGHVVVLDAAFLKRAERQAAAKLARECDTTSVVIAVEADTEILVERLERRQAAGSDASEADVAVLEFQLDKIEPVGESEADHVIRFDNGSGADSSGLCSTLAGRLGID